MLKKILISVCFFCLPFSLSFFLSLPAHAETYITNGYQVNGATWTKEGSPYILNSYVSIKSGQTLTIREGVTVMIASTSINSRVPFYIWADGNVHMLGTAAEPIRIIGLGSMPMRGKNNIIKHTIFDHSILYMAGWPTFKPYYGMDWDAISSTTITFSKFLNSPLEPAIEVNDGYVTIEDSEIRGNAIGITSDITSTKTVINVHNTVFEGNLKYDILNLSKNTMNATNNWWGSTEGPRTAVKGPAVIDPWKIKDPRLEKAKPVCCSNVLFLPGLEASRLYREESGDSVNRLWEPNRNDDVRKLYLDANGSSTDPSIYTSDIIDSAFGSINIYKKFVAMMNGVVADKTINEWLPFAYDWRMNISDIVSGDIHYATTTKKLIAEVERLARDSQTSRVNVVAHSNGGLVAKMLGQELKKQGKETLIDKIILVAVPQLGTPQAAAAMLHGDDQALLKGILLSSGIARTFGLNMPGAYGLLPSSDYFQRIYQPVITFAGKAVGSYEDFTDFITGKSHVRTQPKESDLKTPAILSQSLLTKSQWMHEALDTWQFPTTTNVFSIAGWGIPTTQSINYAKDSVYYGKTADGDGTVLTSTALGYGKNAFFNQGLFNRSTKGNIKHKDILEADPVTFAISSVLATSSAEFNLPALPPYFSYGKPNAADYPWMSWLTVSVYSPVDIDVYNSHGGHIGLVPLPTNPTSDIMLLDNTIGGHYETIGDEKYITLPADDTYSVQLKGTGFGTFTFKVQKFVGVDMIEVASTTYTDLPVTPLLLASTTINALTLTPLLGMDVDGNGIIDIKVAANPVMDPLIHLDSMKTIISSLHLKVSLEKKLFQKIEQIRTTLTKGKSDKVIKKIKAMVQKIENKHWNVKKLTESDRQFIATMFETLLNNLEIEQ